MCEWRQNTPKRLVLVCGGSRQSVKWSKMLHGLSSSFYRSHCYREKKVEREIRKRMSGVGRDKQRSVWIGTVMLSQLRCDGQRTKDDLLEMKMRCFVSRHLLQSLIFLLSCVCYFWHQMSNYKPLLKCWRLSATVEFGFWRNFFNIHEPGRTKPSATEAHTQRSNNPKPLASRTCFLFRVVWLRVGSGNLVQPCI